MRRVSNIRRLGGVSLVSTLSFLTGCGPKTVNVEEVPIAAASSVTTTPSPPSTVPAATNPYSVPTAIDTAYINRIINTLQHIHGEVRRQTLITRVFDDSNQQRIRAIYTGAALDYQFNGFLEGAPVDHLEIKPNPGDALFAVERTVSVSSSCMWVTVAVDDSANRSPAPIGHIDMVLVHAAHDLTINPTPWIISQDTAPNLLTKEQTCN